MPIQTGDKIYVRRDGRASMEVVVEHIEAGVAHCRVVWATILASTYRCHVDQIERQGERWTRDHGMSTQANVNAARLCDPRPQPVGGNE